LFIVAQLSRYEHHRVREILLIAIFNTLTAMINISANLKDAKVHVWVVAISTINLSAKSNVPIPRSVK